jgi:hypothetical protein
MRFLAEYYLLFCEFSARDLHNHMSVRAFIMSIELPHNLQKLEYPTA